MKRQNLTGQRFGALFVLERAPDEKGYTRWFCRCDCGSVTVVRTANLRSGNTTSCGCVKRSNLANSSRTHGMSSTGIYNRYRSMLNRCYSPVNQDYALYGGRGIRVCQRWRDDFKNFYEDIGRFCPGPGASLERIDNDKDYSPDNVRWASAQEQARNRRSSRLITFNGETRSMIEWAEHLHIPYHRIANRLCAGWPLEKALTHPLRPDKRRREMKLDSQKSHSTSRRKNVTG